MTSSVLQLLLDSTADLGALMLIGLFLRAKVLLFCKLLIPASALGGVGFLLGPQLLGKTGITLFGDDWISTWILHSSVLMASIFASS